MASLLDYCAQQSASWSAPDVFSSWCQASADAHHGHASVLLQTDPLGGVNTNHSPIAEVSSPALADPPSGLDDAISSLIDGYQARGKNFYAGLIGRTDDSSMAMLWASLYTFCARAEVIFQAHRDGNSLGMLPAEGSSVPAQTEVGSWTDALQVVLTRIDELRFGLETMIGRSGNTQPDMASRRTEVDNLRNTVADWIVAASATPTAPAVEYELPGDANDSSQWQTIWADLENNLLASWVRLAAVAPQSSSSSSATNSPTASATSDSATGSSTAGSASSSPAGSGSSGSSSSMTGSSGSPSNASGSASSASSSSSQSSSSSSSGAPGVNLSVVLTQIDDQCMRPVDLGITPSWWPGWV